MTKRDRDKFLAEAQRKVAAGEVPPAPKPKSGPPFGPRVGTRNKIKPHHKPHNTVAKGLPPRLRGVGPPVLDP